MAGAVEVEASADVVVSRQLKPLHGHPAGQFALMLIFIESRDVTYII